MGQNLWPSLPHSEATPGNKLWPPGTLKATPFLSHTAALLPQKILSVCVPGLSHKAEVLPGQQVRLCAHPPLWHPRHRALALSLLAPPLPKTFPGLSGTSGLFEPTLVILSPSPTFPWPPSLLSHSPLLPKWAMVSVGDPKPSYLLFPCLEHSCNPLLVPQMYDHLLDLSRTPPCPRIPSLARTTAP